jgi:hypothetical protein
MVICKNKSSGKPFIYIKEIDWNKIEVITPENRIKVLERHLFEDEIEGSHDVFLKTGLIPEAQLKVYQEYERNSQEDWDDSFDQKPVSDKKVDPQLTQRMEALTMKTIEIDDEVYAFLQNQAIPFVETNPNLVLRRLLLKKETVPKESVKTPARTGSHKKAPKADLGKLVAYGLLKEGQRLYFNYKGTALSKRYEAKVSGNCLLYEGKRCKMSPVVKMILEQEGQVIPSGAYRGPDYWYNSDGISVRQL